MTESIGGKLPSNAHEINNATPAPEERRCGGKLKNVKIADRGESDSQSDQRRPLLGVRGGGRRRAAGRGVAMLVSTGTKAKENGTDGEKSKGLDHGQTIG